LKSPWFDFRQKGWVQRFDFQLSAFFPWSSAL